MLSDMEKVLGESARGGFYLTLGTTTSTILLALSVFVVARILGPELYGLYTVSTVIPTLLFLFVDPGINQGITRYSASLRVSGETDRLSKLLLHGILLKASLGLTASASCLALSHHLAVYILKRPELTGYIQLASTLVVLQAVYTAINSACVGLDRAEYHALTTAIQGITKAVAAPILVLMGLGITGALLGYVVSCLAASLVAICLFVARIYKSLDNPSEKSGRILDNLRILVSFGLPLYLSALAGGFAEQYQNVLLAIFTSNQEIGNFKAATNFAVFLSILAIPIVTTLLPAFSKLEPNRDHTKEFFRISIKYTSMVILPITVVLILHAKEVIQIIYGEGYGLASAYLSIYAAQFLLAGLGSLVLGSFFNGLEETGVNLRIALVSSAVIIFLAPVLTWLFRINGTIGAVIFASFAGIAYGLHIARSRFGAVIEPRNIGKIYLASFMPGIPVLMLQGALPLSGPCRLIIGVAVYLSGYLVMIPLTGVVTVSELEEIKTIMHRIEPLKMVTTPLLSCEQKILLWTTRNITFGHPGSDEGL